MKRFEIQVLRAAGLTVAKTAAATDVSSRTVERVSAEDPIDDPKQHDEEAKARMGRPSKVSAYRELIESWFESEPELSSIAILERLRLEGYDGGKSAVYDLARRLRPPKFTEGIARFEGLPGEFCQHDFGQVVVRYADGEKERIRFFASRLKYSRMARILLVDDERVETVCRGVVDAYAYFGGAPLVGVFDNPKTIVTERRGHHVTWNETFSSFVVECGFAAHANWPHRPQEKGSVENCVGFAKGSFFKAHRFLDRADLEAKLEQWHQRVNEERPSRATGEIPRQRLLAEAERLSPLGIDPDDYTLRYSRVVRTDGFVEFEGRRYFVGFRSIGQTLTVRVGKDRVLVHEGDATIDHPRIPENGKYSVLPHQREDLLTKTGARPYVKRQFLVDLCPAAAWFVTEIRHRRPDQWEEEVEAIFFLLERHGERAVREALIEAARQGAVGSEYVVAILDGQSSDEVSR